MTPLFVVLTAGAMAAGVGDRLFWGSLAILWLIATALAFPVDRWLFVCGKRHAVVHRYHRAHQRRVVRGRVAVR